MTAPRDSANALILQDCVAYKAPVGTTAPTDTTTALDVAWISTGWLDEDGCAQTPVGAVTELKGVTGATLAYVKDGDGFTFEFTCLESNETTDSILYPGGTAVTATGVTTNTVKGVTAPPQTAYVIESTYSNGKKRRRVVPLASAVVSGAVQEVYTAFRKYPVQVSAIQASDRTLLIDITDNDAEAVAP